MKKPALMVFFCAGCLALGAAAWRPQAEAEESLFIKSAKIYTEGPAGVLRDAGLLIQNGKIRRIFGKGEGPSIASLGKVRLIDAAGKTIIPGLVDAHTFLSGYYRLLENTEPITSDLVAATAFAPLNPEVDEAVRSGITTVNFSPRSENLVGGMSSILKLIQSSTELPLGRKEAFLKISFNGAMLRPDRAPTSLMGAREMLSQRLKQTKASAGKKREGVFQQAGLLKLLEGTIRPMIAASSFAEINTALKWLEDWGFQGIIVGGEEVYLLADALKDKKIPVLLSPILPAYPDKLVANAFSLAKQGIAFAFVSQMPEATPLSLRLSALELYRRGLSQEEALKTITIQPARILGLADSVGSLEEGKDADLVIFGGEPLDLRSPVEAVYINGRAVFEKGK